MPVETYEYAFNAATDEPPTGSQVRLDAADFMAATRLWVMYSSTSGLDTYFALTSLKAGDRVVLQDWNDHTRYIRFEVTSWVNDMSDYAEIPVTYKAAGSAGLLPQKIALVLVVEEQVVPTPPITEPPVNGSRPIANLGPTDVYASLSDIEATLGVNAASNERRWLCLIAATRYVAYRVGAVVTDTELPEPITGITVVASRSAWRQATVAAAIRFAKSPEVPFGVAGGWDMATYVRQSIPDVDLLLSGQRVAFGVA